MTDNSAADFNFIESVVKAIVDHPEDVVIDRKVDELGVLITLQVHKDDMGQIIGKNGQTAKAMRILLRVIGSKNNARVNFKIEEPGGSEGESSSDDSSEDTGSSEPAPGEVSMDIDGEL